MKRKKSKGLKKAFRCLVQYGPSLERRRDLSNHLRDECNELNPNNPSGAFCCYHCSRCAIYGNRFGDYDCNYCNSVECKGG